MNAPDTLVILTESFPYTKYEAFMETEVSELSKYFDYIYIIPGKTDLYKRNVPDNVKTVDLFHNTAKIKAGIYDILHAISITISQLKYKHKLKKIKHIKKDVFFFICKIKEAKVLKDFIVKNKLENAVYYSVWAYNYATVLAILKQKGIINKLYCRAHGFDVYHFRRPVRGYAQFLEYNIKAANKIICASKAMQNYLSQNYSAWKLKYITINLSVYDRGVNPYPVNRDKLYVLSVSNFHPVKRLPLIAEVLNNTRISLKWFHIGIAPEIMKDISKNLKPHIEVQFIDMISQQELANFYINTPVNLFLHFSESEGGVPLAIQEAVSFGIPVLATEVGGIPEIINETNGILLAKDFDVKHAADIINNFTNSVLNTYKQRLKIKEDWNKRFNAVVNFNLFAQILLTPYNVSN